jgi:hypothetical protein
MPLIAYPTSLPGPSASSFTPRDRLARSSLPGDALSAARERDFMGTEELGFIFSPAEAAAFDAWWRDELFSGGLRFAAAWPLPPEFAGSRVRKFIGSPQWSHIFVSNWRISVTCEVYGRSEAPQYTEPDLDVLLLINGIDSIEDESPYTWSIENNGVTLDDGAMVFDGASWLLVDVGPQLDLGAGNYTVELFAEKASDAGIYASVLGSNTPSYGSETCFVYSPVSDSLQLDGPPLINSSTLGVADGVFGHYAWCRSGTTQRAFTNGLADATVNTVNDTIQLRLDGGGLTIGHANSAGLGHVPPGASPQFWKGRLKGIRIVARSLYTDNFAPPSAPLSANP